MSWPHVMWSYLISLMMYYCLAPAKYSIKTEKDTRISVEGIVINLLQIDLFVEKVANAAVRGSLLTHSFSHIYLSRFCKYFKN